MYIFFPVYTYRYRKRSTCNANSEVCEFCYSFLCDYFVSLLWQVSEKPISGSACWWTSDIFWFLSKRQSRGGIDVVSWNNLMPSLEMLRLYKTELTISASNSFCWCYCCWYWKCEDECVPLDSDIVPLVQFLIFCRVLALGAVSELPPVDFEAVCLVLAIYSREMVWNKQVHVMLPYIEVFVIQFAEKENSLCWQMLANAA